MLCILAFLVQLQMCEPATVTLAWEYTQGGIPAVSFVLSRQPGCVGEASTTAFPVDYPDGSFTQMQDIETSSSSTEETVPQSEISVIYVDQEDTNGNHPATKMIDGSEGTYWRTQSSNGSSPHPHEIDFDLGAEYLVSGMRYLPRQTSSASGKIKSYQAYVTIETGWLDDPVASGILVQSGNDKTWKTVSWIPKLGRYFSLVALSAVSANDRSSSGAEITIQYMTDGQECAWITALDADGNRSSSSNIVSF